jgi:trk system potassium uptake protein TrkH
MIRPAIARVLGFFLLAFAASMLVPASIALLGSEDLAPLVYSTVITGGAGAALLLAFRRAPEEINHREGILLVVMTWLAASFFGALPFWFSPQFSGFTDAFFESASGFTTTGATILPEIETLPSGIQFWRIQTHWIGGIGVVMLMVAILPLVGIGGASMYRTQYAGGRSEKLLPRIIDTAKSLWKVYLALTVAAALALRLAGMNTYEAVAHAFSTIATGGYSTRTASIGGFESPAIEYILIVFMFAASLNFTLYLNFWIGRSPGRLFRDVEVRYHFLIILAAAAAVYIAAALDSGARGELLVRRALFQVTSVITTTGYATYDYEQWPPFVHLLLLVLMYAGGNTGSTSGGLKTFRIVLLLRIIQREFRQMSERRGIFPVRIEGSVIPEAAMQGVMNLVYLVLIFNSVAIFAITACGIDILTSISSVASAMFAIGPALGGVGPSEHYGHLPAAAKWILSFTMLAGRLEFYTFLIVLTPAFWKR